jgi:hypothetical protein
MIRIAVLVALLASACLYTEGAPEPVGVWSCSARLVCDDGCDRTMRYGEVEATYRDAAELVRELCDATGPGLDCGECDPCVVSCVRATEAETP